MDLRYFNVKYIKLINKILRVAKLVHFKIIIIQKRILKLKWNII